MDGNVEINKFADFVFVAMASQTVRYRLVLDNESVEKSLNTYACYATKGGLPLTHPTLN